MTMLYYLGIFLMVFSVFTVFTWHHPVLRKEGETTSFWQGGEIATRAGLAGMFTVGLCLMHGSP